MHVFTYKLSNKEIDFSKPWSRISMKDIVKKYTGIDFDSFKETFLAAKQAVKNINVDFQKSKYYRKTFE